MDIIPFVNRNGLWHLDMPELINQQRTFTNQLIIAERGLVDLLDELSGNIFKYLKLEFHYSPIRPYDAKLVKEGVRYKCVSVLDKYPDSMIWLPQHVLRAMVINQNPDIIYIKSFPLVIEG